MNRNMNYLVVALIAAVAVGAVFMLMQRPSDSPSTRIGEAVEDVSDGMKDAARELDPNPTPGEKIGRAVEDAGDSIQDAAH